MKARTECGKMVPEAVKAMMGLEHHIRNSGLEESLLDLVKLRASQINGCAFCIDMHTKNAKARGESEQLLFELDAWRETPFYSERERAALAWTEAVTLIADGHAPDKTYEEVSKHFSETELVNITLAIVAIKGWASLFARFREFASQPA